MQIIQKIKERARALQLTQRIIAAKMGVSLPTVKRWWSGRGVSLAVLNGLCGLLGLSMAQLFFELESAAPAYRYTLEQEQVLASHPRALAFFDLLVSGKNAKWIQAKYALDDAEVLAVLLKLDRVGLIELHENSRVKLKRPGEPQWILDGPLSAKYRKRMIQSLLGEHIKADVSFYIHDYLAEDVVLIKGKWRELENLMQTCNVRGCAQPTESTSYGIYTCLKPFEWDLRDSLRKK